MTAVTLAPKAGTLASMMSTALRPLGHLAAWLVWHAVRVSLLDDLEQPCLDRLGLKIPTPHRRARAETTLALLY